MDRKFNVWIAYSDLFTNLTGFLLIASLGIFGLIAAGVLARIGMGDTGPVEQCKKAQEEVRVRLARAGTILAESTTFAGDVTRKAGSRDCVRYYDLGTYSFTSEQVSRWRFRNKDDKRVDDEQMRRGICYPIWTAISSDVAPRYSAELTFVGRGLANTDLSYPVSCERSGDFERSADPVPEGFPKWRMKNGRLVGETPAQVIRNCQKFDLDLNSEKLAADAAPPYERACERVRGCIPGGTGPQCDLIRAIDERDHQNTRSCKKSTAQQQAKLLFDACESAPFFDDPNGGLPKGIAPRPGAERRDVQRRFWRDVRFDGVMIDFADFNSSNASPSAGTLDSSRTGSVVVLEVRLRLPEANPPQSTAK
jgi:hypothetical protein